MRSTMQWCAQKIGSYAATEMSPIVPPVHTWTASWRLSSWVWNVKKSVFAITALRSACVGNDANCPGSRNVRVSFGSRRPEGWMGESCSGLRLRFTRAAR